VNDVNRIGLPVTIISLSLMMTACISVTPLGREIVEAPSPTQAVIQTSTPSLTSSATHTPSPSPMPSATQTSSTPAQHVQPGSKPTVTATPTHTSAPTPTASDTPLPPSPTPTETVSPAPVVPTATPGPDSQVETENATYRYYPIGTAQPELSQPCPGCPRAPGYIIGRVVDANGNPLAGVRLTCYNDWHRYPVVGSKGGGEYDIPVLQAETTWYVVVLDVSDQPISPEAAIQFNPLQACWYRLDWQRID